MAFKNNWPLHITASLNGEMFSDELAQDFWAEDLFNPNSMVRWHWLKLVWVYCVSALFQLTLFLLIFVMPIALYRSGGSDWAGRLILIGAGTVFFWLLSLINATATWIGLKRRAKKETESRRSARHEAFPPAVSSEKWLKTATSAELYANGYQTMEQYDPARDLRSAQAQMKFASDLGFAIAGPQVAAVAGIGIYAAGSGFIASQLAKTPAATLGYRQLLKGMGSGSVASTAAYLVLKQEDATPAGIAVAFAGGAIGGGLVKQGLNYFAQLPNTTIPLTGSNLMTQFTGAAYGFGTVNWANTFGITSAGQSWWTRPIYSSINDK